MGAPTFAVAYGMSLGDLEHNLFAAQLSGQNADGTTYSGSTATGTPGDAVANTGAIPESLTFGLVWDPDTSLWRRITARALGNVISDPSEGIQTFAGLYAYSPGNAGWVRMQTANTQGDGINGANMLAGATWLWAPTAATYARTRGGASGDTTGVASAMQPPSTPSAQSSAANATNVITLAAVASQQHRLTMVGVSWSGTAPAASTALTVADGGTTILAIDLPITLNNPFFVPLPAGGITGTTNTAMTITVAAGGAGAVSKLNVSKLTGGS